MRMQVQLPAVQDAVACQAPPGAWHEHALKSDWYSEYDSVSEFGPLSGTVEGSVPDELKGGIFYRNGPCNFERGGQRYKHIIDGDGLVLRIAFPTDDSKEFSAVGRFVQTDTFQEETREDKVCARSSFGTQREGAAAVWNVMDASLKNCANTHVISWGDKVLALYETGLPYRLDPTSLKTLGPETFGGQLRAGTAASLGVEALDRALGFGDAVTAHPHVDAARDRLVIWSNRNNALEGSIDFTVSEWDQQWELQRQVGFSMMARTAPHDFALTPSFYIWVENRMELPPTGLANYLLGFVGPAEGIEADAKAPVRVHLVARGGDGRPEHFIVETPPWFSIHQSHAEEQRTEDGRTLITLYSAGWTGAGLAQNGGRFLAAWGGYAPDFDVIPATLYWRTRIELGGGDGGGGGARLLEHGVFPSLQSTCMDHPHVHPAEEGSAGARYAYMTYSNGEGLSSPAIGWLRLDLGTGDAAVWVTPRRGGCFTQEPVCVPKADGPGVWMLGMLNDHRRDASCLCVLDGDDFERGPICRLWLPLRLPHALHCSFKPARPHDAPAGAAAPPRSAPPPPP